MKLAFCLFKYFPYSGLSRDFMRIVEECHKRGHKVDVYASVWEGRKPDSINVKILPSYRWMNHAQNASFHRQLRSRLKEENYDAVIGFNKMPDLDMYYGADYCYVGRAVPRYGPWYRLTPRYHHFFKFENSVFCANGRTAILSLSEREKTVYQQFYNTPDYRFHLLPSTLDRRRKMAGDRNLARKSVRDSLGIAEGDDVLMFIGSGFKIKGLDRTIMAISSLSPALKDKTWLLVVGQDNNNPFRRLAEKLEVGNHTVFLGGRSDIPELLCAGDLLIHPAYSENTGTVILEAITAGLPVLTTDVCGYASHVEAANAGIVIPSPFDQKSLNRNLSLMMQSCDRQRWSENGLKYGSDANLYRMPETATNLIEDWTRKLQEENPEPVQQTPEGPHIYLREDVRTALAGSASFDAIMRLEGEVYRQAPGRQTIRMESNGRGYFLKTHSGVGWQEIIKNLAYFRLPVLGANNEWHGVHRLQRLGIDTLKIAGYGFAGFNPAKRRSFIITDELDHTVSLEDFCKSWRVRPPSCVEEIRFKRWLISTVARIARVIHLSGANHRDFYLCHFLLKQPADQPYLDAEKCRVYLIDLHRMQIRRRTPSRWVVKDIAGLYYSSMDIGLSRRDLLRFVRIYRDQPLRQTLTNEGRFWRRVRSKAVKLYGTEKRKAEQRALTETPQVTVN